MNRVLKSDQYIFDASAKTITFVGLGVLEQSQIKLITNVDPIRGAIIYQFNKPIKGGTLVPVTGVLTLVYDTTSMQDTDVLMCVVDTDEDGYDRDLDGKKVLDQNLGKTGIRTDVEALITPPQAFTLAWVDAGPEVDATNYRYITYWFTLDINLGLSPRFKFLQKHTYAGTEEYPINPDNISISAPSQYVETLDGVNAQYFEILTNSDQLFCVTVKINNTTPYLQLQIQAGTVGATAMELDAAYITKGY